MSFFQNVESIADLVKERDRLLKEIEACFAKRKTFLEKSVPEPMRSLFTQTNLMTDRNETVGRFSMDGGHSFTSSFLSADGVTRLKISYSFENQRRIVWVADCGDTEVIDRDLLLDLMELIEFQEHPKDFLRGIFHIFFEFVDENDDFQLYENIFSNIDLYEGLDDDVESEQEEQEVKKRKRN